MLVLACGGEVSRQAETAPPPVVSTLRLHAEPTIRVGVAWGDSVVEVGAAGRWWIHEAGASRPVAVVEGGKPWKVTRLPFERALRVVRPDGYLSSPHFEPLAVARLDEDPLIVGGTPYPGSFEIALAPDGTLTAVNVVALETYLEGVVAKELGRPGQDAMEALRAQAIAARTYALKRRGSRAEMGFDVYGTVEDQAYGGIPPPEDSLAVRAVSSTRGRALVYEGFLIDAFYHSTCGGHTARVQEVLEHPPAPYLTSVRDAPDGRDAYWCRDSKYFRWTVTLDSDELQERIERNLPNLVPVPPDGVGILRDLDLTATSPEGRALAIRVVTSTGRYLVTKNAIRRLFADDGGRWLRSTLFLFRPVRERDRIVRLTLIGGGWGHGVGMCQVGAMARARAGQSAERILAAYYNGVDIVRLY